MTTNPVHLLRALLRACSYLPDSSARQYCHAHILHRYRHKSTNPSQGAPRARKAISLLNRASNGDVPALTKVLHHTYGRSGYRRHILLNNILKQHSERHTTEPPTTIPPDAKRVLVPLKSVSPHGGSPVPAKPHNTPPTAFERLIADQILHSPETSPRGRLKIAYAPIPAESIFGRPIAIRREEGLRKRWKRQTMDKILPPLPEDEWNKLRDLAIGVAEWEGQPKRRTRVGEEGKETNGELLTVEYLKAPIRHAHSKVRKQELDKRDWHVLTPRFMQRLYRRVWELCPTARWDEERRDWVYTWGGRLSATGKETMNKVTQRDLQLFEGIEKLELEKVKGKTRGQKKKEKVEDTAGTGSGSGHDKA